jgi:beta-glucosidase/6-phospho-beta-glucosidase/beta-galactosidase
MMESLRQKIEELLEKYDYEHDTPILIIEKILTILNKFMQEKDLPDSQAIWFIIEPNGDIDVTHVYKTDRGYIDIRGNVYRTGIKWVEAITPNKLKKDGE